MTVSIAVPIICLCYIKKNTVTEDIQYRKAMAKFSLFLILGSVINIAGQPIPGMKSMKSEATAAYLFLVLGGAINIAGLLIPAVVAYYTDTPGVWYLPNPNSHYHHSLLEAASRTAQEDVHLWQDGKSLSKLCPLQELIIS